MDQNSQAPQAVVNPKQQVIEALKGATNVLVTVSTNPSVDQLAACIGLTLMMNKLDKHATAVFSGQVPSTLDFLQPEKTLETNTDSLRDFIISLDRSKADKLRYKIEDNVVKIYITPYRTSLSEADLEYSQGDFNVDVVIALGVDQREHIDEAIAAHGRILHDATVIGVSYGQVPTDVGSVNWHDPQASSLSEMLVSISEAFQSGILDTQMATAFLTGIVSETERFSNDKTSPKVMTMSAQLMAAGANQQLIAAQLNPPPPPPAPVEPLPPVGQIPEAPESPAADKTAFDVPHQPEEGSGDATAPISLHQEESQNKIPELKTPAPAVDLGFPGQETEDEFGRIHIDRTGRLHDSSETLAQLEESVAEKQDKAPEQEAAPEIPKTPAPEPESPLTEEPTAIEEPFTEEKQQKKADAVPAVPLMRGHEKVIKPLDQPKDEPSADHGYIFEPPSQGGTFTGATYDDPTQEDMPSMGSPAGQMPILSHDHTDDNPPAVPAPTPEPAPVVEPPQPPEPPAPESQQTPPAATESDADSARKAVLDAMSSLDYQPVKPEPISALNAQPINLDAPMQESQQNSGLPTPPPVPPPFPTQQAPLPSPAGDLTLPIPQQTPVIPQDPSILPPQQ